MEYTYSEARNDKAVLKIIFDCCPESPREWDNLGTMICWHKRYNLGDEHNYVDKDDFIFRLLEEYYGDTEKAEKRHELVKKQIQRSNYKRYSDYARALDEAIFEILDYKYVILPVYMYEHSGIALNTGSFSCIWDSGQVGWIYVSKEKIRKEYGVKRITKAIVDKVASVLNAEVELYSQYVNGDVVRFTLEDLDGNVIDSCGGFYGYDMQNNGIADYIPNEYKNLLEQIA